MKVVFFLLFVLIVCILFNKTKLKKLIGEKTAVRLYKKCPHRNGSYQQCTNNGSYRHSEFDIDLNHFIYKNNPRVNIWKTT